MSNFVLMLTRLVNRDKYIRKNLLNLIFIYLFCLYDFTLIVKQNFQMNLHFGVLTKFDNYFLDQSSTFPKST